MYFTKASFVLSALAIAEASAATVGLGKAHNHAARHAEIAKTHLDARNSQKRDLTALSSAGASLLSKLGCQTTGINAVAQSGTLPWLGSNGAFTNEFVNNAGEDLHLVVWGPMGSWINANQPQITVSIPSNTSKVISFPVGWSGAWAPVYANSKMVNGQISDTWGEGTFAPPYSVVDVSREVNMNGRSMSIVGPQCTTDMNRCSFHCPNGQTVCTYGYKLMNCATGSQPGANMGAYDGADSGGCGGMGNAAALKTYLG